ncbi:MAG: PEP/pyruvate-binding domain-containing protein [Thermoplasmata archaeon]
MPHESRYERFFVDIERMPAGVRVVGKGFVGGKALGLIFAAHAREFEGEPLSDFPELVAFPESTIITTDHFDTFMEENGLRTAVQEKCDGAITKAEMARRFVGAELPSDVVSELRRLLAVEKRPLAVRSSSYLEDDPRHSFAGIYESYFIPNRGSLEARLHQLETAIKLVYLSTFGENAREYRLKHRISWKEEKMAILIQNLIGKEYPSGLYYPLIAGVAFSKNFYPWSDAISTDDGVARIVMGLGTRAVGRYYARVFTPAAPHLRPEGTGVPEILRYSQSEIDALDLNTGALSTRRLEELKFENELLPEVAQLLIEGSYIMDATGRIGEDDKLILTFDPILRSGSPFPFVRVLRSLLTNLQRVFGIPVDMEFALNLGGDDRFYILQVRPLGGRLEHRPVSLPARVPSGSVILRSRNVLGNGLKRGLRYIVYVPLERYRFERGHAIARRIGEINRTLEREGYVLIGPGRWATTHPELGIPVDYAEISNARVIVECSYGSFTPELSYGTHFFGDMVVSNVLYIPVFPEKGDVLNTAILKQRACVVEPDLWLVDMKSGVDVYVDGRTRTGLIVRSGGKGAMGVSERPGGRKEGAGTMRRRERQGRGGRSGRKGQGGPGAMECGCQEDRRERGGS